MLKALWDALFHGHSDQRFNRLEHGLTAVLKSLRHFKEDFKMNMTELATQLTAIKEQADKAKAEVIAAVAALDAALQAAGGTTPAVDAAVAALKTSVQSLDDLNPDSP